MIAASHNPTTDVEDIASLREYPAQAGCLEATLKSARDTMVKALEVVKRSRSSDAQRIAGELEFQVDFTDRMFARIAAARSH